MDYEKEIIELKQRIITLEQLLNVKNQKIEKSDIDVKRDKTKYVFNGKIYPKNRLVLAVIQEYVINNNPTFLQLRGTFDKSLQGSLNVVEILDAARRITDCSKRYFTNEKDIINLSDKNKVVVCTQWGIFNINKFIAVAKNLNFDIQEI